jgi:hypothetical protein
LEGERMHQNKLIKFQNLNAESKNVNYQISQEQLAWDESELKNQHELACDFGHLNVDGKTL